MMLDKYFIPLSPFHPLHFITSALALGICWEARACSKSLSVFLVVCMLYALHRNTPSNNTRALVAIAALLSFCAGNFLLHVQADSFNQWLQQHYGPVDALVTVTDISPCSTKNYKYAITAQLKQVREHGESWQSTPYNVAIYTQTIPHIAVSDTLLIPGIKLSKPRTRASNTYSLKHNLGATIFCENFDYILLARPETSCRRALWLYRKNFTERLYAKMSSATASFYSLLFMGTYFPDKKNSESLRTPFQIWGILHYLARSGLHLVVFIMIWNLALLALPCRPRTRELILLILCSVYFVLSWPTLSFVRAFTTYLAYKAAMFTRRPAHTLYTITLITFLFLVANPTHLFCLDFQLSFGLTYALAWVQQSNFALKNFLVDS